MIGLLYSESPTYIEMCVFDPSPISAADIERDTDRSRSRHTHEDLSDMMALVEAARKVLAATARSFAHIQMGSQRG